ncbi:hypothetical protein ABZ848_46175 [Streptomyces sp. NPDC047081]|uniref:hypothetical protein n=1 Tax=Streptomyces sp. NPDC047081 TaxID=3154706 RepID=UPI0033ECF549
MVSMICSKSVPADRARSMRKGRSWSAGQPGALHWAGLWPASASVASSVLDQVVLPMPPTPWKTSTWVRGASRFSGSKAGEATRWRLVVSAAATVSHCAARYVNSLAQEDEGAIWWWQFAAGAGDATAAYCLYLQHLRRGELRDGELWIDEALNSDARIDINFSLPAISEIHPTRPRIAFVREAVERLKVEEVQGTRYHLPDHRVAERIRALDTRAGALTRSRPAQAGDRPATAAWTWQADTSPVRGLLWQPCRQEAEESTAEGARTSRGRAVGRLVSRAVGVRLYADWCSEVRSQVLVLLCGGVSATMFPSLSRKQAPRAPLRARARVVLADLEDLVGCPRSTEPTARVWVLPCRAVPS